ncbi:hypothetical protein DEU38_112159 [Rhodococcus sp. AG1013]|nr:hypothetical protein DEU38_112159 [Rhodococcus sp. AG1013]
MAQALRKVAGEATTPPLARTEWMVGDRVQGAYVDQGEHRSCQLASLLVDCRVDLNTTGLPTD